jgi:antitoxin ParD1/3/4
MTVTLNDPRLQKLIDDRVKSGKYGSAEEVMAAALFSLEQQESVGDFAPGELDALIAVGTKQVDNDELLDGEAVFREIDQLAADAAKKGGK